MKKVLAEGKCDLRLLVTIIPVGARLDRRIGSFHLSYRKR